MKLVINGCYGGFDLSADAQAFLGKEITIRVFASDWGRTHPKLIECVEQMGARANGPYSRLFVIEIPDDVKFGIRDHDGWEIVVDEDRVWEAGGG
jgi:hypothetical protein